MGKTIVREVTIYLHSPNQPILQGRAAGALNVRGLLVDQPIDENLYRRTSEVTGKVEGPPPPPPPTGHAPAPTPVIDFFPTDNGLVPSPGSGVATKIYRRCEVNIHLGTGAPTGWTLGPLREVVWSRFGLFQYDVTRDFTITGWGLGSASNTKDWEVNRIFRPENDLGSNSFQGYYTGGTQLFRVRDQWHSGATVEWSPWGEVTISWPDDRPAHPDDPAEVAYLNLARVNDS
jgi:hypothetical protein